MLIIGIKFNNNKSEAVDARIRRKSVRVPVNARCIYSHNSDDIAASVRHVSARGTTLNLSESGLCIEGIQCIVPDTPVRLLLYVGKNELHFEGTTRWAEPSLDREHWRMGLEITSSHLQVEDLYKRLKLLNHSTNSSLM